MTFAPRAVTFPTEASPLLAFPAGGGAAPSCVGPAGADPAERGTLGTLGTRGLGAMRRPGVGATGRGA
ncbi:hypothetical protein SCMU_17830 [Sinomonas cyclohexanicum]|uniref:Uncharacterized protein n=1 Tax=Sinomonas cyclohexanicum TaxID=322009 RepID=A0ABN6FH05_SINCY|nr:hypothetical protein SCMU_17830 [Corynebacterium cyclohexanicum]